MSEIEKVLRDMRSASTNVAKGHVWVASLMASAIEQWALRIEAATRSQSERVSRLEEALKPFARLAGPINGEEGRPTYLEAISGPNGTDELKLETYVGDGTRFEVMDAEDFRRARSAINQSDEAAG